MLTVKKVILGLIMLMMLISGLAARAQSAPATALTVAQLEQGMGRLFVAVEKAPHKAARIQLLESFHQALRKEIRSRANSTVRDQVYWKAIDLDVLVTKLIDQNCNGLRESLQNGEHNMTDNDSGRISPETEKAIQLAQLICQ